MRCRTHFSRLFVEGLMRVSRYVGAIRFADTCFLSGTARTCPFYGKTLLSPLFVPPVLLIFVCRMHPVNYPGTVRVSIYYHIS